MKTKKRIYLIIFFACFGIFGFLFGFKRASAAYDGTLTVGPTVNSKIVLGINLNKFNFSAGEVLSLTVTWDPSSNAGMHPNAFRVSFDNGANFQTIMDNTLMPSKTVTYTVPNTPGNYLIKLSSDYAIKAFAGAVTGGGTEINYFVADSTCGNANGGIFVSAPTTNLCNPASNPSVNLITQNCVGDPCLNWWSQYGTGDEVFATKADCNAELGDPICTAVAPTWSWTCPGQGGAANSLCSAQADNDCAANTCSTDTCWNNIAWVTGTKDCAVDNGCAAAICANATCWNGFQWATGTKLPTFSNQTCNKADSIDCAQTNNCGKTNAVTASCTALNSCTGVVESRPLNECGASCISTSQTCPSCSGLTTGEWREVAP